MKLQAKKGTTPSEHLNELTKHYEQERKDALHDWNLAKKVYGADSDEAWQAREDYTTIRDMLGNLRELQGLHEVEAIAKQARMYV